MDVQGRASARRIASRVERGLGVSRLLARLGLGRGARVAITSALVVIVLAVGFLVMSAKRDSWSRASLAAAQRAVETLPDYQASKHVYDQLLATHHGAAVDAAFSTRRKGARQRFDVARYADGLTRAMAAQARSEGNDARAESLLALRDVVSSQIHAEERGAP